VIGRMYLTNRKTRLRTKTKRTYIDNGR